MLLPHLWLKLTVSSMIPPPSDGRLPGRRGRAAAGILRGAELFARPPKPWIQGCGARSPRDSGSKAGASPVIQCRLPVCRSWQRSAARHLIHTPPPESGQLQEWVRIIELRTQPSKAKGQQSAVLSNSQRYEVKHVITLRSGNTALASAIRYTVGSWAGRAPFGSE